MYLLFLKSVELALEDQIKNSITRCRCENIFLHHKNWSYSVNP